MLANNAADIVSKLVSGPGCPEDDVERGFEAEIGGQVVLFIPTSPYAAKVRRDDETTVWLAYVQAPELSRYVDERVTLRRHAPADEVIDGYLAARRVRKLGLPVRRLLEIASVLYSNDNWQAEAAADLGVSAADIAAWLDDREPPDWLEARLIALTPRLAYAGKAASVAGARRGWSAGCNGRLRRGELEIPRTGIGAGRLLTASGHPRRRPPSRGRRRRKALPVPIVSRGLQYS